MGSYSAQARFDGVIAFTCWPRADVAALLPPDVVAAGTAETHPVVFVFGTQRDAAVLFAGFAIPSVGRYLELGVLVPSVRPRAGGEERIYVVRMYASYFPAVWNGNAHFGFAKELARLAWDGRAFAVRSEDGDVLIDAVTDATEPWTAARAGGPPGFAAMRAVFAGPVVGRKGDGRYVRSAFGWDFADADVRPADVHVVLAPGLGGRRCTTAPPGAFEVRGMLWKVAWPSAASL